MKICFLKSSLFLFLVLVLFQLEASPWTSPPDTLSSTSVSDTTVATNASGASVAAWIKSGKVKVSLRPAGVNSSWTTGEFIPSELTSSTTPVVAINDNGDAMVIWERTSPIEIRASFRPVGTGEWSSPEVISTSADSVDSQKVAMNNSIAVGVWGHEDAGVIKIETNTFNIASKSWDTSAEFLSDDGATTPDVAVGSDSTTAVIWQIQRTKLEIEANIRSPKGTWSSASIKQPSIDAQDAVNPAIGIDSSGKPVAIWSYQFDGTSYVIQGACWTGSAWSTPVNISGTLVSVQEVELAVNGNGDAAAAWLATTSAQPVSLVYAAFLKSLSACSWTAETLVSNSAITAAGPQVGVDALGNAIVVWNENTAVGGDTIQSRFFLNSGAIWSASEIVALSTGVLLGDIALGVGSGGNAVTVWTDSLPMDGMAAYFAVSYPPLNVTAKRKNDRFLGQKDLYNHLRGNNHPNISPVSYSVFRADGTTLVKTVGSTNMLKFEEHNRRKNVFETYQVVTNNSNGGESFPYTYTVTK